MNLPKLSAFQLVKAINHGSGISDFRMANKLYPLLQEAKKNPNQSIGSDNFSKNQKECIEILRKLIQAQNILTQQECVERLEKLMQLEDMLTQEECIERLKKLMQQDLLTLEEEKRQLREKYLSEYLTKFGL
ncbi:hypothetical protein [aff. Roholtiella sp. LEGE 12411]|uniref:hypothetical protein n=1 Tax=aff. Roholtiella sp. LEGE 12411 TaxID=1828822 RepID=UPI001880C3BF|nr:hypothetical protein [aff. Roholtiella sp. LEGE 12411]MBE9036949.1 hypothetical protein [aff. Roholtiella sp. LEGE 12411]